MEETQGQSELGAEKRRHESILPTASRPPRMSVTLFSDPYSRKVSNINEPDKLGEELNNGMWFIILLMFSVGKLEIAMVLARPQWMRVKDLIWVCWSPFGHFIRACWKKKVRKQQSNQWARLGRPTKIWDTYFTQKGQKDVSLTINILCADYQYCRFKIQSINQRLHYFEFVDSKIANFVLESSVHLCNGERKKLQTLWEPNFILLIINLAACWNFQLIHFVIQDGSLSYVRRSDMLVNLSVCFFFFCFCFNRIWFSSNISSSCTQRPHGTFSCSGKPCTGQTSIFIRNKLDKNGRSDHHLLTVWNAISP